MVEWCVNLGLGYPSIGEMPKEEIISSFMAFVWLSRRRDGWPLEHTARFQLISVIEQDSLGFESQNVSVGVSTDIRRGWMNGCMKQAIPEM